MLIFFGWILFTVLIGVMASKRNRSVGTWIILSLVFSPLITGLFLLALGNAESQPIQPALPETVKVDFAVIPGDDYHLEYTDASGITTERQIRIDRIDYDSNNMICFCYERKQMRIFKVNRIVELVHLETGEVVFNQDMLINTVKNNEPVTHDSFRTWK